MAFDRKLAERVRGVLGTEGVVEKKMFGGLCFMVNDAMAVGVEKDRLMVRVGPDAHDRALSMKHAMPMDFTGRPMKGLVFVDPAGLKNKAALKKWVDMGATFARSLPPKKKPAKSSSKKVPLSSKEKALDPAVFGGFSKKTFGFLRGIQRNNRKDWFETHRDDYQRYYVRPAVAFVDAIGPRLQKICKSVQYDARVNGSLFRINRDVRFSQDKAPYKSHLSMMFWEGESKGWSGASFFMRLTSDRVILGAGSHRFDKDRLPLFRDAVVDSRRGAALTKVASEMERSGYTMGEPSRKKVPRGFDPDHPRSGWLLHDGIVVLHEQKLPKEVEQAGFVDWATAHYRAMAPVFRWVSKL